MLLEHVDELTLRLHDFRGNPAALLAGVIARIDRLKDAMVTADEYVRWAADCRAGDDRAEREREFGAVYSTHDRLLAQQGALDFGDLVLHAHALLRDKPHVRARAAARYRHLLVDDAQDLEHAAMRLVLLLAGDGPSLTATGDDDQAIRRMRGGGGEEPRGPRGGGARAAHGAPRGVAALPGAGRGGRGRGRPADRRPDRQAPRGARGRHGRFWRAANERAQAQAVAAEVERLVRAGVPAEEIAILVRSVRNEGQAVALALEERAVPHRLAGATAFFQRAEVKDVLAWLRLLVDPSDAGAVVRALARPPVELRSIDLARCVQISRRRKLDMVNALVAATESPQLPPEARERILGFLKLHRSAAAALDTTRPDVFVHRLIDRLGLRRRQLFAAQADVVERLVALARLGELATAYARRSPQSTPREFARSIAAVAEAGLRDEEGGPGAQGDSSAGGHADRFGVRAGAVAVMAMQASHGLSFEHVFVLGLQSSRMPGARRRAMEPIPDALLHETLPPDTRAAHVDEMRRVLHVAVPSSAPRSDLSRRARRLLTTIAPERGLPEAPSDATGRRRGDSGVRMTSHLCIHPPIVHSQRGVLPGGRRLLSHNDAARSARARTGSLLHLLLQWSGLERYQRSRAVTRRSLTGRVISARAPIAGSGRRTGVRWWRSVRLAVILCVSSACRDRCLALREALADLPNLHGSSMKTRHVDVDDERIHRPHPEVVDPPPRLTRPRPADRDRHRPGSLRQP